VGFVVKNKTVNIKIMMEDSDSRRGLDCSPVAPSLVFSVESLIQDTEQVNFYSDGEGEQLLSSVVCTRFGVFLRSKDKVFRWVEESQAYDLVQGDISLQVVLDGDSHLHIIVMDGGEKIWWDRKKVLNRVVDLAWIFRQKQLIANRDRDLEKKEAMANEILADLRRNLVFRDNALRWLFLTFTILAFSGSLQKVTEEEPEFREELVQEGIDMDEDLID